jgi:hypothetical protein
MLVALRIEGGFLSLVCAEAGFDRRRRNDGQAATFVETYAALRERPVDTDDQAKEVEVALFDLGQALYRWLDGPEGWLGELRPRLTAPFLFDIMASLQPEPEQLPVLLAPWELLADETGFLAEDALLRYAPARRLGFPNPNLRPAPPVPYRLGIAFMAASPRGARELDYEAEEIAILKAAKSDIDLVVEDSGDPRELGRRIAKLPHPLPVLHLSCHGDNAWIPEGVPSRVRRSSWRTRRAPQIR